MKGYQVPSDDELNIKYLCFMPLHWHKFCTEGHLREDERRVGEAFSRGVEGAISHEGDIDYREQPSNHKNSKKLCMCLAVCTRICT